jgi:hypothetical protein
MTRRALALLAVAFLSLASRPRGDEYQVAPFDADVTIPIGHACMGGGIANAKEILDPLFAKGFVLLGGDKPVVVCAVDFCQLDNDAFDRWRDVLAEAARTTRQRVMLATVHQHDAPIIDLRAQALLDEQGLKGSMCDAAFSETASKRVADAIRKSLMSPKRVTHVGVGQAKIEQLASNRRIARAGAKVHWNRTSADRNYDADPEGEVDPVLRTITLWDGDRAVVAWSAFSIHPMSYYGRGQVTADFVGIARARRQADDPAVAQIYFTGCAGDTTAGKYNNGRPEERAVLADRLYQGMVDAWKSTKRTPLGKVDFRSAELRLDARDGGDFAPDTMRRILADPKATRWRRNMAAMGLSWRERLIADRPIDIPCLDLGGAAQFMVMPAETFVGYQLAAQKLRPDRFVMTAGFGDGAPGYVPMDAAWREGYDDGYSWIGPASEKPILDAMRRALNAK